MRDTHEVAACGIVERVISVIEFSSLMRRLRWLTELAKARQRHCNVNNKYLIRLIQSHVRAICHSVGKQ